MINSYNKYYNNLKQNGGLLEGEGTYGIVYSTPRLPIGENYVNNDNEVCKIFKDELDYYTELYNLSLIKNNFFINPELKKYFIQKIKEGPININVINEERDIFTKEWFGNVNMSDTKYEDKLNFNNRYPYTIIFEKGINYKIFKRSPLLQLLDKMCDFFQVLNILNIEKLYIPDVKLDNLVIHDGQFKFIDYSEINDFESILENYGKFSLIDSVFYFVYPFDYQCVFKYNKNITHNYRSILRVIDTDKNRDQEYTRTIFNSFERLLRKDNDIQIITFDMYNEDVGAFIPINIELKYNTDSSRKQLLINAFPLILLQKKQYEELNKHLYKLKNTNAIKLTHIQIYSFAIMLIDLISINNTLPKNIIQKIIEIILLCVLHKWGDDLILPNLDNILLKIQELKIMINEL